MRVFLSMVVLCGAGFAGCARGPAAVEGRGASEASVRIVSLAPSLTEAVCAVGAGDLLVGRTSACNYPPEIVDRVPVVGGFGTPSLELLADVQPTLVLQTALADEALGARIDAMGIARARVRCEGVQDVPSMLRRIGRLTQHPEKGRELAATLNRTLQTLRRSVPPKPRRNVYAEIWHDPMTTMGRNTFLSDLIALAGGRSIGDAVAKDYYQISPERVLNANPDVILCLYMGKNEGASEALKARPGWQHLAAVRHDAVYDGLPNDVLLRPGPRVLEGVALLRACLNLNDEEEIIP